MSDRCRIVLNLTNCRILESTMKIKPIALITGSDFVKGRRGSTAAEFALSLMLLVLILFGITTFGWMFYLENSLETAAREGARAMAVKDASFEVAAVTCDSAQAGFAEDVACAMLPHWGSVITVDALDLCDAVPQQRAVRVEVSANGQDVALADIFGFFNGKTINSTVEMRRESECPPPAP